MNELKAMADRVRRSVVDMAHAAGAGGSHLGGGLSCVEIMTALYGGVFKFDVENPTDINRDRFLTGKAHCILLCRKWVLSQRKKSIRSNRMEGC